MLTREDDRSAAADGWKAIRNQTPERASIIGGDESVAVGIASPRSAIEAILRYMRVMRIAVGELELERGNVGEVDDAVAVAVAAQRRNQSIDRRSGGEENLAVRSFCDVDDRSGRAFDDSDRLRRTRIVEVVERLRDERA